MIPSCIQKHDPAFGLGTPDGSDNEGMQMKATWYNEVSPWR